MGKNTHEQARDRANRSNPPSGPNFGSGRDQSMQAPREGTTQRRNVPQHTEPRTRDEGRDDRRSGSDSNPP